jgi:hypothetical protein
VPVRRARAAAPRLAREQAARARAASRQVLKYFSTVGLNASTQVSVILARWLILMYNELQV